MKTYLLDTYNRYKRYSETLDVKTKLCNRPWVVFNDGGEREVYKFKEDGTIKIILSGRVTTGTWEYDPSDKTLEIAAGDQAYMVHPGLYEDMLLALQVDGTDNCAFLIEENNAQNFEPKTYTELIGYFQEKERREIAAEEERKLQLQRAEKERLRLQIEQEQQRKEAIERQKREEQLKDSFTRYFYQTGVKKKYENLLLIAFFSWVVLAVVIIVLYFWFVFPTLMKGSRDSLIMLIINLFIPFSFSYLVFCYGFFLCQTAIEDKKRKKIEQLLFSFSEENHLSEKDLEMLKNYIQSLMH